MNIVLILMFQIFCLFSVAFDYSTVNTITNSVVTHQTFYMTDKIALNITDNINEKNNIAVVMKLLLLFNVQTEFSLEHKIERIKSFIFM